MPSLTRDVLDDVELALLFGADNPNSPFFLRTMYLLRMMLLNELEYKREERDKFLVTLIMEMETEKNIDLREQMILAEKTYASYMANWNQYQQQVHRAGMEELKIPLDKLSDHLKANNEKLEDEIKKLNIRLRDVDNLQVAISNDWNKLEDKKAEKLGEKLKDLSMTDKQIKIVQAETRGADINHILKVAPHLVKLEEHEVDAQIKGMSAQAMLMYELRQVRAIAAVQRELGISQKDITPRELLNFLKANPEVVKALRSLNSENPDISEESRSIIRRALVDNKPYIEAQIENRKMQIEENNKRIEHGLKADAKKDTTPKYTPPTGAGGGVR